MASEKQSGDSGQSDNKPPKKSMEEYKKLSAERLQRFRQTRVGQPMWEEYVVEEDSDAEEDIEEGSEEVEIIIEDAPFPPSPPPPPFGFPPIQNRNFQCPPYISTPIPRPNFPNNKPRNEGSNISDKSENASNSEDEEAVNPTDRQNISNQEPLRQKHGTDITNDERVVAMEERGAQIFEKADSEENTRGLLGKIFHLLLSISILAVFAGICITIVMHFYDNVNISDEESELASGDKSAEKTKSESAWLLGGSTANNIIRNFYLGMGDIDSTVIFTDISIRGYISIQGNKEEFYCIKKPNNIFLKIGIGSRERSYLLRINDGKLSVFKLADNSIKSDKTLLNKTEAWKIRALVLADDFLFEKVFDNNGKTKADIDDFVEFKGQNTFAEKTCDILTLSFGGLDFDNYFDAQTHELRGISTVVDDMNIKCTFERYISGGNGYKIPEKRNIYINDKLYASVYIDFVTRNRGVIFPK